MKQWNNERSWQVEGQDQHQWTVSYENKRKHRYRRSSTRVIKPHLWSQAAITGPCSRHPRLASAITYHLLVLHPRRNPRPCVWVYVRVYVSMPMNVHVCLCSDVWRDAENLALSPLLSPHTCSINMNWYKERNSDAYKIWRGPYNHHTRVP